MFQQRSRCFRYAPTCRDNAPGTLARLTANRVKMTMTSTRVVVERQTLAVSFAESTVRRDDHRAQVLLSSFSSCSEEDVKRGSLRDTVL